MCKKEGKDEDGRGGEEIAAVAMIPPGTQAWFLHFPLKGTRSPCRNGLFLNLEHFVVPESKKAFKDDDIKTEESA